MKNYSQVSYFNLTAYFDTGTLKYMYFILLLFLYISIVVANILLTVVICVNRSLHEPMYLFLCSLFVNELYGSSGMFPHLLSQILKEVHTISFSLCFLQIVCVYSYGSVECLTSAVMSYDRYLAICLPLQYHIRMTRHKVFLLNSLSWLVAFLLIIIITSLSSTLQLCGNIIHKVYCDNYLIIKLACFDTTVNNITGLILTIMVIFIPLWFILYSYMRILKVCFSGSKQTRHKAVTTCTPHLASVINFVFGCFFEVVQTRFNLDNVPNILKIIFSIYFLTCQPLFNPLIYGLNMSKIRTMCKNLFN